MRTWWNALRFVVVETAAAVCSTAIGMVLLLVSPLMLFTGGWIVVPALTGVLHRWAGRARLRSRSFLGRPPAPDRTPGAVPVTRREQLRAALSPNTGRELWWLVLHGLPTLIFGVITVAVPLGVVSSLSVLVRWRYAADGEPLIGPFTVTSWAQAAWAPVVALGYGLLAWWLVPAVAATFARITDRALTPSRRSELSARVDSLTLSRAAALDAHTTELRRIERDLHDGAQNRLVGVVMMLGLAKRALDSGDAAAVDYVERAQQAAADALAGLRSSVHDIYPPVLADLGLSGALSAVAGRSAVPCDLRADDIPRVPAAVEAAVYFVVAESLNNVAKYSNATHAQISLTHDRPTDRLVVEVVDDGVGGASIRPDGGLEGIARRVQAFEGTMTLSSPVGGPTVVRTEMPCGS
ncbi:MAG: histidine kinase [Gordonia sp. (in: high G+C Gram-positive bacteria)]|jgi:signal transduction histidine kinase|nr:histidine kinase [Gordonia sp. (in: high G+C Gram-positive bacteria)]